MPVIPIILAAASLAGGIMQAAGGRKVIDPEWLKKHFGAEAVNEEMVTLFNQIINSPYGQQTMADAASQGAQFESQLRSASAATGMGAGEGGKSGASIFSESAAGGATKALTREARGGIFQQTLPAATQLVRDRLNAYMGSYGIQQQQPTGMQILGSKIGSLAEKGLGAYNFGAPATPNAAAKVQQPEVNTSGTAGEGTMGSFSRLALPNQFVQERMQSMYNTNAVQPSRFRASLGGSF